MSYVALGVGAVSLGTAIWGGARAHSAQKKLENQQPPKYTPNQAISNYYQEALERANTNPYASAFYQNAQRVAGQNQAAAISNLQDRRAGVGGIGAIMQGTDNSIQKAGSTAEGLQRQDFGMLGHAAQMQAGEGRQAFDINSMLPYDQNRELYEAQAVGGNQMENAGIQNIGGAANSYNNSQMYKNMFGGQQNGGGQIGGSQSMVNGIPQFSGNNTGLTNTGGVGSQGNYGYLLNPNSGTANASGSNMGNYLQMAGLMGGTY
jgi:hypothetical protein